MECVDWQLGLRGCGGGFASIHIRGDARLRIILAPSYGRGRRAKRGGVGIPACENIASRSQPPPLRGTSFQRKEVEKWSALTGN